MTARDLSGLRMDRIALDAACERLGLGMLVLFGSWATGDPPPGPESDVDLAATLRPGVARASLWDYLESLGTAFPQASRDLAFLAAADPLFR